MYVFYNYVWHSGSVCAFLSWYWFWSFACIFTYHYAHLNNCLNKFAMSFTQSRVVNPFMHVVKWPNILWESCGVNMFGHFTTLRITTFYNVACKVLVTRSSFNNLSQLSFLCCCWRLTPLMLLLQVNFEFNLLRSFLFTIFYFAI